MITKNNFSMDILDSKQDFLIAKSDKKKKGFLYEFNLKNPTDKKFSTSKASELIDSFGLFPMLEEENSNIEFTVHFTGIKFEDSDSFDYKYFKIIIGFPMGKTLTEIEENLERFFQNNNYSCFVIINKRRVINKSKASVEEYFTNLNAFISEKFPKYDVKQLTFENRNDRYEAIDSSEIVLGSGDLRSF